MEYGRPLLSADLFGQCAPEYFRDVLGCVVPETIDVRVGNPPRGAVGHGVVHLGPLKVQRGHEGIEPSGQPLLVPKLGVHGAVRQVQVGHPVGVLLVNRVLLMNVIGDVVDQYILAVVVGGIHQGVEVIEGAKPTVNSGR